ncbi:MAG: T9SS type A sorting domain-containing protein [Bacteroidetes bacterium]|nr:MAG: T9SS type A sorting domain-containing protein [Bacteroidota bacterium]
MKKIVLTLSMVALTLGIFAQCTPNPIYTDNGNWPKILDVAWVDSNYTMVVTHVVPLDTTVMISGIPVDVVVDSVKIINFTGLPVGYNYTCNPNNCAFMGGTIGCTTVSGTTNNQALVGIHPLQIFTKTYSHLWLFGTVNAPQLDTVKSYYLEIKSASTTGIYNISTGADLKLYPNPSQGFFTASVFLKETNNAVVKIYNTLGEIVNNESIRVTNNTLTHLVDLSDSNPGIYFMEISTSKETIRQKVLLK